jgi:HAD superfamily hydrolase (TIGR01509 family)
MLKAFIFDMDGVILDSEPNQLRAFNRVLQDYNISIEMDEFKKKYMGHQDTWISEKIVKEFSLPLTKEEFVLAKRAAYFYIISQEEIHPFPGAVKAIKEIHAILPLGIASSSNLKEIEMITKRFGIRKYFSVVLSTFDVPKSKPAPDVYLRIADLMNVDPKQCGAIEDTPLGVKSAKSAGMKCVAVTNTHEKSELAEADNVINDFKELVAIIKNINSVC